MKRVIYLITFLYFLSYSVSALEVIDSHHILTKIDNLVEHKDFSSIFECERHHTFYQETNTLEVDCNTKKCLFTSSRGTKYFSEEVQECHENSIFIVNSNGHYYEINKTDFSKMNSNFVRLFLSQKINDFFGIVFKKVQIQSLKGISFLLYEGLPFQKEIPAYRIQADFYLQEGLSPVTLFIDWVPSFRSFNQVARVKIDTKQDGYLWYRYAF